MLMFYIFKKYIKHPTFMPKMGLATTILVDSKIACSRLSDSRSQRKCERARRARGNKLIVLLLLLLVVKIIVNIFRMPRIFISARNNFRSVEKQRLYLVA